MRHDPVGLATWTSKVQKLPNETFYISIIFKKITFLEDHMITNSHSIDTAHKVITSQNVFSFKALQTSEIYNFYALPFYEHCKTQYFF